MNRELKGGRSCQVIIWDSNIKKFAGTETSVHIYPRFRPEMSPGLPKHKARLPPTTFVLARQRQVLISPKSTVSGNTSLFYLGNCWRGLNYDLRGSSENARDLKTWHGIRTDLLDRKCPLTNKKKPWFNTRKRCLLPTSRESLMTHFDPGFVFRTAIVSRPIKTQLRAGRSLHQMRYGLKM